MAKYTNDPRWTVSKFAGMDKYGNPYKKGDRIFYYPSTRTVLAGQAAEAAARDFEAAAADEDFYNGH